jgi:repressor LexA
MPATLSDLERKILDYMVQYLRTNTYQPSIREIGERFDIKSTKTVSEHLRALADKGYVERDPSRSRGVRILGMDLSSETVSVPCYVAIPDGGGVSSDGVEAYYSVDRRMAGPKGSYFLRARGDGFQGVGVEPGDFLLVEPASATDAREGDLLVVRRPDESGLYRYSGNGNHHFLVPARDGAEPFAVVSDEELQVTGRVVGLFRIFDQSAVPVSATAH